VTASIEELEERLARLEVAVARVVRANGVRVGTTVAEFRERGAAEPKQDWSEETWKDFTAFVGSGEGPADLAEHTRDYLNGDR
jgi:hypothetical protein